MDKKWLKYSKWTILYLVWVCGLIIFFSIFVTDPDDRHDLLVYNTLFTILLPAIFVFMSGRLRQVGLIAFFLISIGPSLVELGWFLMDRSVLIRGQFWVIFSTNPAETSGLLSMVTWWQWLLLACYVAITVTLLVLAVRESRGKTNYPVAIPAAILAISLVLIPGIRYNVPAVNFYNSYRVYRIDVAKAQNFMNNRIDISGQVHSEFNDSLATLVVVIGESLNRNHCSLYGYCRPTTPRLDKRNDIAIYRNVRTFDYMTQPVLQRILTFATDENPDARWDAPTLPELLNASGWHTYWFEHYVGESKTANAIPTGFASIAKLCDNYYINGDTEQFDGANLNHLKVVLADSASRKRAVFLHLIGNHFPYEQRYPEQFEFFADDDICSPYLNRLSQKQKQVINAYDNAVRYNDWFIDSLVNMLDAEHHPCAMLYFSDHGEEIFDCDFYAGRSFNHVTPSLYEIPCLFWQNDSYTHANPLYINEQTSYNTAEMIHTFLDFFAVSYAQKDTCRSLFRKHMTQENE